MPQKTKKEKILAEKRRQKQLLISSAVPSYSLDIKSVSESPSVVHIPQVSKVTTGHINLKKELLKISIFTLGAVVFQLFLYLFIIK